MRKKDKEIIEIEEDVRIPGTDILLEKGDRIRVIESMFVSSYEEIPVSNVKIVGSATRGVKISFVYEGTKWVYTTGEEYDSYGPSGDALGMFGSKQGATDKYVYIEGWGAITVDELKSRYSKKPVRVVSHLVDEINRNGGKDLRGLESY